MSKRIVILGGGVGGLAAAVRLGGRGFNVTLVEKNPCVGGKLNRWVAPHPSRPSDRPFLFDTGPSLLTLPFIFDDLFAAVGQRRSDWLTFRPLDPISRFTWADGTSFSLHSDPAAMRAEVSRFSPHDVDGWIALLQRGSDIWDQSAELFLFHAPEQVLNGTATLNTQSPGVSPGFALRAKQALSMLTIPLRIGMFSQYSKLVDRHLKHPKLREVLYQYATYSGASPFKAPATLAVIPHAEQHFGGWYIDGGMYELARSLEKLAIQLGVTIRTSSIAEQILIEPCRGVSKKRSLKAAGVRLTTGEVIESDVVLCNADTIYSYRDLIDPKHRPHFPDRKLNALEPGGSGMVLLLGIEGTYPQLAHHNKFMPADYTSDLRAMFDTKTIPDDPCIYVCVSTRSDPTQAPENCENLFVLVSAPSLNTPGQSEASLRIDWRTEEQTYRDQIVRTLETRFGLQDLSKRIVVEKRYTPMTLKTDYNANAGSIYGLGSNSRKTAFLRPPNRDGAVDGLFFAGGATHPGGGLPLVALSGKIAAELIEQEA